MCGSVSGARTYFLVLWVFFFVTSGTSWCAVSSYCRNLPTGRDTSLKSRHCFGNTKAPTGLQCSLGWKIPLSLDKPDATSTSPCFWWEVDPDPWSFPLSGVSLAHPIQACQPHSRALLWLQGQPSAKTRSPNIFGGDGR